MRLAIEELLDTLPAAYSKDIYDRKCDAAYQHIYEKYPSALINTYAAL